MRSTLVALFLAGLGLPTHALAADIGSGAPGFENIWNGIYFGANAGYVTGTVTDGSPLFPATPYMGELAGVQVGANFASSALVVGVQADVDWANASGKSVDIVTGGGVYHLRSADDYKWTGAVTERVGAALGPIMPYALGGISFAGNAVTQSGNDVNGVFEAAQQQILVGWTAGAGISAMLTGNLSGFLEYRYAAYMPTRYPDLITTNALALSDHSVRAGLNYHFR